MKKIIILLSAALLLFSCKEDFLDKKPLDRLSEEAVFNSDALAESFVNSQYTVLQDPFQEGNIGCITDEAFFRYGGTSTRFIASGWMTPDNIMYQDEGGNAHNSRTTILNIWNRSYKMIHDMNHFLSYVQKGTKMSQEAKDRLMGEVFFLRAWTYTNLIERYAGVPIIKDVYSLNDNFDKKRDNFDDCVDFILEDLAEAGKLLPEKENGVKGRINKDIVLALRCRLTLIAASPLFNDPENPQGSIFRGTYSAEKWQRAKIAAKAIVDRADVDGAYNLDDKYEDFWKDPDSPELIWAKYFTKTSDSNATKKAQLLYSVVYFNGWTSMEPTQAMFMDYEMNNGKKFFEEGSGYDPNHPFRNRDPRFYKSIAAPFSLYGHTDNDGYHEDELLLYLLYDGKTMSDFEQGKKEPDHTSIAKHLWHATNTTGLELNKWYIPEKPVTESETGSVLYPWFRLAEMYLNYAEAAFMTGDETTCRTYINKIRNRADVQMPEITESGEALWDRLVNERRIELAFEAVRYFDVRRWKVAPFYENIPFAGMRTMILKNGAVQDTVYRIVRLYDESKNNTNYYWKNSQARTDYIKANGEDIQNVITYRWLGKDYQIDFGDCCLTVSPSQKHFPLIDGVYPNYLMPIPRNEITKSKGSLEQNPGYK